MIDTWEVYIDRKPRKEHVERNQRTLPHGIRRRLKQEERYISQRKKRKPWREPNRKRRQKKSASKS